jgi:DNA replication protein DnaC
MTAYPIRHQRVNMFIPPCFEGARLEDFEDPERLREVGPMALILGPNGVGKSHLAAALAKVISAMLGRPKWASIPDVALWIRRSFDRGAEDSEAAIRDDLQAAGVLVLDDLLAGRNSDFLLTTLLGVVNGRICRGAPTIVTCDRGLKEIEAWDSSLASRLGGFDLVKLTGEDRRLRGRRVFEARARA